MKHPCRALLGLPVVFSFVLTQGCVATREWVRGQTDPLSERAAQIEGRVMQTETRVENIEKKLPGIEETLARVDVRTAQVLSRFENLKLERRLVLNLRDGALFAFNSAAVSPEVKREIDGFLSDVKGESGDMDSAVVVVAGHTDGTGSEEYNFELGRRRADNVARYLITQKQIDPLRVVTVSYGKSAAIADNGTRGGRARNRRVEILIYSERVATATSVSEAASTSLETSARFSR